ncbi:MAG: arginine repressor, partial [Gemmatimonadota bacterium]|nr:arginine repressor [Gemmatimonadota bacterium]
MKAQRHAAILTLVHRHRIASQEQLRALLLEDGVEVTQA